MVATKDAYEANRPPFALRRACAPGERTLNKFDKFFALVLAPGVEGCGFNREFGELRPRSLPEHGAARAFLLARQQIELDLQSPDMARNQPGLRAPSDLVPIEGFKDQPEIIVQFRLLAVERMKPPVADIVHERLKAADPGERVETPFHALPGDKPNAKGDDERFNRRFDRKIKQQQAAGSDKRRGDEEDLDLRSESVDQGEREIDHQSVDHIG